MPTIHFRNKTLLIFILAGRLAPRPGSTIDAVRKLPGDATA